MMNEEDSWHVGSYNHDDTITTFVVSSSDISLQGKEEIFKKPEDKIHPLVESDISITSEEALNKGQELVKKEYPREMITKNILILQTLSSGQVYNITFISTAMNTINVKVDSKTGEIKGHKISNLMDFVEKDKK